METAQQFNSHLELSLSRNINPSLAVAAEAMTTKIILPPTDGSDCNICCWHIWSLIVLPTNHPFPAWLNAHYVDMDSFRSKFAAYVTVDNHLTKAKGIYHLKYTATEATKYFKEQFKYPSPISLPDPHAICKFIQQREQCWKPILSQAYPCVLRTTIPHGQPFGLVMAPGSANPEIPLEILEL